MSEQYYSGSRPSTGQNYANQPMSNHDGQQDTGRPTKYNNFSRPPQAHYRQQPAPKQANHDVYGGTGVYSPADVHTGTNQAANQYSQPYSDGYQEQSRPSMQQGRQGRAVLTKPNRKFEQAYENEHGGSSGA
ncbi:MAG: hypothetical protein M1823_008848, partial [Watsoniomyces obsoletus]